MERGKGMPHARARLPAIRATVRSIPNPSPVRHRLYTDRGDLDSVTAIERRVSVEAAAVVRKPHGSTGRPLPLSDSLEATTLLLGLGGLPSQDLR